MLTTASIVITVLYLQAMYPEDPIELKLITAMRIARRIAIWDIAIFVLIAVWIHNS